MQPNVHAEVRRVFEAQQAKRWRIAGTTAEERVAKLKKLRAAIVARREELQLAIQEDFGKNPAETDVTEIFPALSELNHAIRYLHKWMKPVHVSTPWALFGTRSEYRFEPKGVVLILSPWNYPFNLMIVPLISAIAAGNCAVVKPSSKVPRTSAFLKKLLGELFGEDEVTVFEGEHEVSDALLDLPFDHVFFTGSPRVGSKVMAAAAKHLSPVTLELGGKSPVIVDETADMRRAAERVMWGKFINAGQTCVAPDYLLIHESRLAAFVQESRRVLERRYGTTDEQRRESKCFARLVSQGHAEGLKKVLTESIAAGARVELGGGVDVEARYLAPTLLSGVTPDSPIMREEIFGPILPILTFHDLDEAIRIVQERPKPLALYVFSEKPGRVERVLSRTTAGGTCVNTLIVHLGNGYLPFGGVGTSGMGNYHGHFGFMTFSHQRAVLRQGKLDLLRFFYPPYTPFVRKLIWATIRRLA